MKRNAFDLCFVTIRTANQWRCLINLKRNEKKTRCPNLFGNEFNFFVFFLSVLFCFLHRNNIHDNDLIIFRTNSMKKVIIDKYIPIFHLILIAPNWFQRFWYDGFNLLISQWAAHVTKKSIIITLVNFILAIDVNFGWKTNKRDMTEWKE